MRRIASLALSMLAVVLLVVGCADDDNSEERQESQTGGVTAASTDDADPPDGAVRERRATGPAPPTLKPQPVNSESVPVRLGDRFEWCADIQRDWDRQAQAQAHVDAEIAARRDAVEAYENATDELDKAEALLLIESAELRYSGLLPVLVAASDAAVRPVRPWEGVDETQVIALERAREAFSATADQALLALIEIAYPASPEGEPGAAELLAGDEAWSLVPHGGVVPLRPEAEDDAMTLEASLAQLARLQDEIVSWSAAYWSAVQEMEAALLAIHEAESASDAIAAHERLLEAAPAKDEVQLAGWNASDAAEKLRRAYVLSARQALQAGTMSTEEHRGGLIDVEAAVRAILERIRQIHAGDDAARLVHAGSVALQGAANGFVLADTAAWTAFQASLSESCKPRQ